MAVSGMTEFDKAANCSSSTFRMDDDSSAILRLWREHEENDAHIAK
jgi:hypothetical protein